jgi:fermentation-respiration switch protein FrsA (DUF1100 family)
VRIPLKSVAVRIPAYYLTICAGLYFMQHKLLFPSPATFPRTTPAVKGLPFEDLRIPVGGGERLHAWWIPAAATSRQVVLVFHGNGYVMEEMVGDELASLHEIGANLMLTDYRGYGLSSDLRPNETTLNEDAEAALGYLLRERHIPIGDVIVLGRSIGSGPATQLARNHSGLGGLILESPFTSIDDAAARIWYYRIFPIALLLRSHFDNLSKIVSVGSPLLIVSGTADTLTPKWMAEKIFANAHQPKQLYMVQGAGHDDLLFTGGSALIQVLRKFVRENIAAVAAEPFAI